MKHLLLFIVLLFVGVYPVLGQDAESTVESQPIAIVTEEAAAPVIVCEDGATCNVNEAPVETPETPPAPVEPEPWFAKYVAIVVVALGALRTLVALGNTWLEGKKTDKSFITGAELVGRFTPAAIRSMAVGFVKDSIRLGQNLQELLDEATDDVPYVVKVSLPPTSSVSSTGADYTSTTPPMPGR